MTEHAPLLTSGLTLPFGLGLLQHEAHRLGVWVVGVRASEFLSFGVDVGYMIQQMLNSGGQTASPLGDMLGVDDPRGQVQNWMGLLGDIGQAVIGEAVLSLDVSLKHQGG